MNTFCIPIKVTDEDALYDQFYPSGLSFSGELVAYLEDYIIDRKPGEDIVIELQAEQEPNMGRFRNTYDNYIEKLIERNKKEIGFSDFRAFASLVLGAIFIMIGYTFGDRFDTVTAEVISAVGSFAMWASIALFIETLPTLRYKDRVLKRFSKAEIRYRILDVNTIIR